MSPGERPHLRINFLMERRVDTRRPSVCCRGGTGGLFSRVPAGGNPVDYFLRRFRASIGPPPLSLGLPLK